jgi:hypothetical protein
MRIFPCGAGFPAPGLPLVVLACVALCRRSRPFPSALFSASNANPVTITNPNPP